MNVITDGRDSAVTPEPLWWAIGAIVLDRAVTLPFWGYEANPLTASLGRPAWLVLSVALIVGLSVSWYQLRASEVRAAHWLMWGVAAVHLLAAVTNVGVVTGVL